MEYNDLVTMRCSDCGEILEWEIRDGVFKIDPCDCVLEGCAEQEQIDELKNTILDSCGSNLERIQKQYELEFNE